MSNTAKRRGSRAVEDYLKTIWGLSEWTSELAVSNAAVADRLGVSTSSASEMVRKLTASGLVRHERWGGVELSDLGVRAAMAVVRRHRLLETFLSRQLGYSWDEVHEEADVLEHAVSDLMIERIDRLLGFPHRDPHGDPIPTPDGTVHRPQARPLASLQPGEQGYVARIVDESSELLRWLAGQDLRLDTAVEVRSQQPFGGPLVVAVEVDTPGSAAEVDLGLQAVTSLWVASSRPDNPDEPPPQSSRQRPGCPYHDCLHRSVS